MLVLESTLEERQASAEHQESRVSRMVSVHTSSPPTVHSSGVSVTVLSAILRVWVWILETQVGLSLV